LPPNLIIIHMASKTTCHNKEHVTFTTTCHFHVHMSFSRLHATFTKDNMFHQATTTAWCHDYTGQRPQLGACLYDFTNQPSPGCRHDHTGQRPQLGVCLHDFTNQQPPWCHDHTGQRPQLGVCLHDFTNQQPLGCQDSTRQRPQLGVGFHDFTNRLGVKIPPVGDRNLASIFMISVHDFTKQQPPRSVIRSRGPTHAAISAIGRNWSLVHRKDEPVAPPRSSLLAPAPPNPNGIHWL